MATKSKKWKPAISFAAFFLGMSLVLGGTAEALSLLLRGPYSDTPSDAFQEDYQDTVAFRDEITNVLQTFLAMAVDGPVYNNYSYSDAEWEQKTAELVDAREWAYENSFDGYGYDYEGYEPSPEDRQRYAEAAKKTDRLYQNDKNLLYRITYDGAVKYENASEVGPLDGPARTMPEGYNFLLYFDGTRATVIKDGVELELYGDGIYRQGDWYLPGYKNFTVDEKTKKATVCIAALKEPQLFLQGNYSSRLTEQRQNHLYWIACGLAQVRVRYLWAGAGLLAGIVLLVLAFLWRRDVGAANRAIARVSGRIWFEGKVLLWLAFGILPWLWLFLSSPLFQELLYREVPDVRILADELLYNVTAGPWMVLLVFWMWYLSINDVCRNKRVWRNSLVCRILTALRVSGMKYPIQERMTRPFGPVYLTEVLLCAAAIAAAVVCAVLKAGALLPAVLCGLFAVLALGSQYVWYRRARDAARDIGAVTDQIAAVRDGKLTDGISLPEDADLREAAAQLSDIRQGMQAAVEEQIKNERTKVELVTNVSHDLKTPLTSIVSYVDLLKQEELPEHVRDYVRILDQKAQRLKAMVLDVFEVSKAASGQLPVELEELDFGKLLSQTVADMEERIAQSPVTVRLELPEEPVRILADGERLYRVFQNLLQNALQYSLEGSRVYVSLHTAQDAATACVKNTSRQELPRDLDLTERFVRGDESRTDGGSGLGLSIASSFTQACGGIFRLENIADLFVATVEFKTLS